MNCSSVFDTPLLVLICILVLISCELSVASQCVKSLDSSKINDNYCDCLGENDEPNTSACADVGLKSSFHCSRPLPVGLDIHSSKVFDGICDCCDGADEAAGLCVDNCAEVEKAMQEKIRLEQENIELAQVGFSQLVAKAKQTFQKYACNNNNNNNNKEETKESNEENVEEKIEQSRNRVQIYQQQIKKYEEDIAEYLKQPHVQDERIQSLLLSSLSKDSLISLVMHLAYELKDATTVERLIAEELDNVGDSRDPSWLKDESFARVAELNNDIKLVNEKIASEEQTLSDLGAYEEEEEEGDEDGNESDEKTGKKHASITKELIEKTDFGPSNVYLGLLNDCFSLNKDTYVYEVCFFKNAKQDSTSLGKFQSFDWKTNQMRFNQGDHCFATKEGRSLLVNIKCGKETRITNVFEPSTCMYEAVVESPAACSKESTAAINNNSNWCDAA